MVIDIKRKLISLQLGRLGWIIFVTAVSVLFVYDILIPKSFTPYKVWIIVGLSCCYTLYYCWGLFRGYAYFFYSDNTSKLVFRYYRLRPFGRKLKMIEIPKNDFAGFRIEQPMGGFRKKLFVSQRMKGKTAQYKAISISLLSKKDIKRLQESLQLYKR
jgi:hypothetical protein